jgi:hypothetical protein
MINITNSELTARQSLLSAGLIPASAAYDRGTNTLGDVLTQTSDGRDLNDIWGDFNAALGAWNEGRSAIVSALTYSVGEPIEDVPIIALGDFEEASEFGVPKGIGGAGLKSMGYSFKWYDLAARFTWQYLAEASAGQVESIANMAFEADNRLVFKKVLSSLFRNTDRVANINSTNYSVYSLYNGADDTPPPFATYTHTATHDHYLVSGGAAVDSGDLDDMLDHIAHHGYGPKSGASVALLVNKAQMATIRAFRIASNDSYDFIPAPNKSPFLLPANTGGVANGSVPNDFSGLEVEGAYGDILIIENDYIPAGYMAMWATGGSNNLVNPVGIREHRNEGLRGMRLVKGADNNYPLIDSYYNRGFGTGIRHRGAAVIMQVKASGNYVIPPAYSDVA